MRLVARGLCFVLAVVAVGCERPHDTTNVEGPCFDVDCGDNPFVKCDDTDGRCKCGPTELDLVCGKNQTCSQQGRDQYSCVASKCELVQCDPGETCDLATGACKCGTGPTARECDLTQTCELGRCRPDICDTLTCDGDGVCDPTDGICKCGPDRVTCDPGTFCYEDRCADSECGVFPGDCSRGETCILGGCLCAPGLKCTKQQQCVTGDGPPRCEEDPCGGVNCPPGSYCSQADSLCHCGSSNGEVCLDGAACTAEGTCEPPPTCGGVVCEPEKLCDTSGPFPGCYCGSDYCPPGRVCHLDAAAPYCERGGDPCADVGCNEVPGSSCDPEDSFCKCGGLDGIRCEPGSACVTTGDGLACGRICDPLAADCDGEELCGYYPELGLGVCVMPGDGSEGCTTPQSCVSGWLCEPTSRACRRLCSTAAPDCPEQRVCTPAPGRPDDSILGYCAP